jgi:hypothetical protein
MARFVFGHAATIDTFLTHLRAAAPQHARR